MSRYLDVTRWAAIAALAMLGASGAVHAQDSDAAIKDALIKQSIARYSGSCPCPYNTTSNGSRCGRRSAYSKPGGASPLCYAGDVSDAMVESYRQRRSN